jgi:hypothetical protein
MCNPDAEYMVNRPEAESMIVAVTRERFKDVPSLPPLAYEAKVIDLGRRDRYGEPVTSLALIPTDCPAQKEKKTSPGRNQEKGLAAMREWVRTNKDAFHISSDDLKALLKTQGIKVGNRRAEVIAFLTAIRVLNPAAFGHTVHPEALK